MSLSFFFNDTATTEIYTLSLHDALPICDPRLISFPITPNADSAASLTSAAKWLSRDWRWSRSTAMPTRSEEHTSELQSRQYLVCRLLLEKNKNTIPYVSRASRCLVRLHL